MLAPVAAAATRCRSAAGRLRRALSDTRRREKSLAELEQLEREVTLSTASEHDLHFRLLPTCERSPRRASSARAASRAPTRSAAGGSSCGPTGLRPMDRFAKGIGAGRPARPRRRPCEDVTWRWISTRSAGSRNRVLDEVEKAVVGKREALELLLLGVLADGHVLIEDYPGLAKTLMARSFAQTMSMDFSRIQFTPDLMPSDITGSSVYNQREADFEFRPGPIFANLLLADEINRAPPKTQAALLEAMQERQVTTEGADPAAPAAVPRARDPEPDRVRGHVPAARGAARPVPPAHVRRLSRRARTSCSCSRAAPSAARDEVELEPVIDRDRSRDAGARAKTCSSPSRVGLYMVDIVTATRDAQSVQVGASPRGSLALLKLSRCRAALDGRDYVTPDDVKSVAVPALAHRLTLRPELWVQRVSAEDVVRERLETVPTPAGRRPRAVAHGDALRRAEARLVRGSLGDRAAHRTRLRAARARRARRRRSCSPSGRARAHRPRPASSVTIELEHDRALEGDEGRPPTCASRRRADRSPRPLRAPPEGVELVAGPTTRSRSARGRRATRPRASASGRRAGAGT